MQHIKGYARQHTCSDFIADAFGAFFLRIVTVSQSAIVSLLICYVLIIYVLNIQLSPAHPT
jgi:hypothetical protein